MENYFLQKQEARGKKQEVKKMRRVEVKLMLNFLLNRKNGSFGFASG
jgi:hypothetical protein